MRPDLLLRLLAEETGERLFALDLAAASGWQAREASAAPAAADKIAIIPFHGVQTANGFRFMGRQYTPGMNTFRQALGRAPRQPRGRRRRDRHGQPGRHGRRHARDHGRRAETNAVKPVVAMVDTLCASAAYWVASQCSQIWAQPSAELGSIGVQGTHVEMSGALDQAGLKATIVRSKNAPYKNEANPFEPLSEEALAALQASADEAEDVMMAAIGAGRKVAADKVRADFGKGRMMSAARAKDAGMVDRIGTMAELLGSLRTQSGSVRRRFSALAFE
jgi:hypothetical protein